MKVRIHLPRPSEAKITYNENDGTLVLEPIFYSHQNVAVCGHIEVISESGRKREPMRYRLIVSGANGRLLVQESKAISPRYDRDEDEVADVPRNSKQRSD